MNSFLISFVNSLDIFNINYNNLFNLCFYILISNIKSIIFYKKYLLLYTSLDS